VFFVRRNGSPEGDLARSQGGGNGVKLRGTGKTSPWSETLLASHESSYVEWGVSRSSEEVTTGRL